MVTSVNQVRHFYVATAQGTVSAAANAGTIDVKSIGDALDKQVFFEYKGADTVLRSDLIPVKGIEYVKGIKAEDLRVPFKSIRVALDANVNGGNPVVNQDYVLGIEINQFFGNTDEGKYFKDAAVHVTSALATPAAFYAAMANELNVAFSREVGASKTSNPYLSFAADANGIVITEKEQAWHLGMGPVQRILFDVFPTTIYTSGQDLIWGVKTDITPAKASVTPGTNGMGDGKQLAELEWFCMGERGDQYRMMGYPNYIPTKYMVDASKEYNVLEIHYAFNDTGVNSYKSEKDITIVAEDVAEINKIIAALNTATGLSVATL